MALKIKAKASTKGKASLSARLKAKAVARAKAALPKTAKPAAKTAAKPSATAKATIKAKEAISTLPVKARVKLAAAPFIKTANILAKRPKLSIPTGGLLGPSKAQKAIQAVAPIAAQCSCKPAPVVRRLNARLCAKGYPANTGTNILAHLHDMNKKLEKAALQRLATTEHARLRDKATFERLVLERLAAIAKCLPDCHPTKTKAFIRILRAA